jgi:hypothetical protein
MTKRALFGLVGVAMMGVACGTNPTAVQLPELGGETESTATASGLRPGRMVAGACVIGSVSVTAYDVAQSENGSTWRTVSLRAEYRDANGNKLGTSCTTAPEWSVSPLNNYVSFSTLNSNAYEARLIAPSGSYTVSVFAPNKVSGQVTVAWE